MTPKNKILYLKMTQNCKMYDTEIKILYNYI